jgi:hypothetical protein
MAEIRWEYGGLRWLYTQGNGVKAVFVTAAESERELSLRGLVW